MNFRKAIPWGFAMLVCCVSFDSFAGGGISITGTRIVYSLPQKQQTVSLSNSSKDQSFLVQSWVEDASGKKSRDFIVTPPLYVSGPENENSLRLIHVGGTLPNDRESLYYFVAKSVPSTDEKKAQTSLNIAAAIRIKLFVRPKGLQPAAGEAPDRLVFKRMGKQVRIENPTPYYLTLVNLKAGGTALKDVMVPPKGQVSDDLPEGRADSLSYNAINDYGALSQAYTKPIN
ncbi:fimbria/pilus periplasmic chaperone [Xanthomonas sontii]|uniref:fimbria/pilus periplasmic chaperone n=1 Tax=Xanthomonas sontii TaxID=2650745 RepID=UPI003F85DA7C